MRVQPSAIDHEKIRHKAGFLRGAGGENRTLIVCLEGRHISHYTTPALEKSIPDFMVKYKRMLFEKIFSGNQSSKDMHSNQYAAGSVSQRTFSQRKSVEQGRSRIASYRHSKLGYGVAPRGLLPKGVDPANQTDTARSAVQPEIASPPTASPVRQSFQEPSGRSFNPYA